MWVKVFTNQNMSDSDGEGSAPPDVEGDAVPADAAAGAAAGGGGGGNDAGGAPPAAAAATHPVWAAAAGGGGRRGATSQGSMFAPISMMELELRRRGDLDGASSTASERGGSNSRSRRNKSKSSSGHKSRRERPQEYDDADSEGTHGAADEQASEAASDADLAGAAFGGKRKSCMPCGSEASDDALSVASSQKRAAHDRAFPVEGVYCVGCTLPAKVVPVVDFIQKNMASMSELALFKMAALVYKTKVADPAEEEGVEVPPWHWKDIRAHFTLHAVDPKYQRFENIRTLGAMRKTLELQLLRRDAESGEQSLDKQNAEQILKIITASSRELTLLYDATSTKKK